MSKKVPITKWSKGEDRWIDYGGKIFILSMDGSQPYVRYQMDGTMCRQGGMCAAVEHSFESSLKYFNPEFWYNKTSWGKNYPKHVYFDVKNKIMPDFDMFQSEADYKRSWKDVEIKATEKAKPAENILKAILKDVRSKTGVDFELNFDSDVPDYGRHWYEAYIPLKYKNKKYLLTWENCD